MPNSRWAPASKKGAKRTHGKHASSSNQTYARLQGQASHNEVAPSHDAKSFCGSPWLGYSLSCSLDPARIYQMIKSK